MISKCQIKFHLEKKKIVLLKTKSVLNLLQFRSNYLIIIEINLVV